MKKEPKKTYEFPKHLNSFYCAYKKEINKSITIKNWDHYEEHNIDLDWMNIDESQVAELYKIWREEIELEKEKKLKERKEYEECLKQTFEQKNETQNVSIVDEDDIKEVKKLSIFQKIKKWAKMDEYYR